MSELIAGSAHGGMMYGFRWSTDWPFYKLDQEPVPFAGFTRSKKEPRVSILTFGPIAVLMVKLQDSDRREPNDA